MTYQTETSKPSHLVFYSLLDAMAFLLCIASGACVLGYLMSLYVFRV